MLQMVKDLTFCGAQKSPQGYENTRVNAIEGGTWKGLDRKSESFVEMGNLVVVVKRGDLDAQDCGAGQDCGDWKVKITTQVTRWIR
jgi:hypothetical protein